MISNHVALRIKAAIVILNSAGNCRYVYCRDCPLDAARAFYSQPCTIRDTQQVTPESLKYLQQYLAELPPEDVAEALL